jgi:hypothetical protein
MNKTIVAVALGAALLLAAPTAASASTLTKADAAALATAETHYASVLNHYADTPAWLAQYRAALSMVVTEQGRVTADIYPAKPKPPPAPKTITTPIPTTTTTTEPTTAAQASASGDNPDASIDPDGFYTGSESLLVQAQPSQPGTLTWDINCNEGNGGTADSGSQQAELNFPTTEQLTLPTADASHGCSIVADAELEGSGTVTISWIVTGTEVNDF